VRDVFPSVVFVCKQALAAASPRRVLLNRQLYLPPHQSRQTMMLQARIKRAAAYLLLIELAPMLLMAGD
jgi:hypothetical protein